MRPSSRSKQISSHCKFKTTMYIMCFYLSPGNDNIHTIVSSRPYTLRIDLEDFSGKTRYAEYTIFKVGDENSNYLLNIGGYSGTAGMVKVKQDQVSPF